MEMFYLGLCSLPWQNSHFGWLQSEIFSELWIPGSPSTRYEQFSVWWRYHLSLRVSAFLCLHSGAKGSGVELSGIFCSLLEKKYSFGCECVWGPRWWSEHNLSVLVLSCHRGISWDGTRVLRLGCMLLHPENPLASPISYLFTLILWDQTSLSETSYLLPNLLGYLVSDRVSQRWGVLSVRVH